MNYRNSNSRDEPSVTAGWRQNSERETKGKKKRRKERRKEKKERKIREETM
jgi:hypothetical protein